MTIQDWARLNNWRVVCMCNGKDRPAHYEVRHVTAVCLTDTTPPTSGYGKPYKYKTLAGAWRGLAGHRRRTGR